MGVVVLRMSSRLGDLHMLIFVLDPGLIRGRN